MPETYNEVKTVGSLDSAERPQDRADVAQFYGASSATLLFNEAARQIAQEQGRSLSENARDLALINMAISDSFVVSFFNKYYYNFWRPETAIREGNTDGNPANYRRPSFRPVYHDPMFPELSLKSRERKWRGSGSFEAYLR